MDPSCDQCRTYDATLIDGMGDTWCDVCYDRLARERFPNTGLLPVVFDLRVVHLLMEHRTNPQLVRLVPAVLPPWIERAWSKRLNIPLPPE